MSRKIIAFAGFEGSGKDYRCQQLLKQGNYKHVAFADALRDIAFSSLGINKDLGSKYYESLKTSDCIEVNVVDTKEQNILQHISMNFRKYLEYLGTEGIRKYDKDFWAHALIKTISEIPDDINICISDLRFHNEYKCLKTYARDHGYEFELVFCDYHSDRYKDNNIHASTRLASFLKEIEYSDGDVVREEDMQHYIDALEEVNAI